MRILSFDFNFKLFLALLPAFIISVAIGTLTYSSGIYLSARLNGTSGVINCYNCRVDYENSPRYAEYQDFMSKPTLKNNPQDLARFNEVRSNLIPYYLSIDSGGIILIFSIGLIAFIALFRERKQILEANKLSVIQYILAFLSLLLLRESVEFLAYLKLNYSLIDIFLIADYLQISRIALLSVFAVFGALIGIIVVFVCLPLKIRLTFLLSGFIGAIAGAYLWFFLIGPRLLTPY